MGEAPCTLLEAEMALDLLEGEIAQELPAHMRAFARAHADGRPPPPAPLLVRLPSTLATARTACRFDEVADRGLALVRLVAPLLVEDDPAVVVARNKPQSWEALATLAAARDAAARARFDCGAVELSHRLHGSPNERAERAERGVLGPAIEGWQA